MEAESHVNQEIYESLVSLEFKNLVVEKIFQRLKALSL